MPCGKILAEQSISVTAYSIDAYTPLTPWLPCTGMDAVKFTLRLAQSTNVKAAVAFQAAAVRTDNPGVWQQLFVSPSPLTADGEACSGVQPLGSKTTSNYWIRFGILYGLASGTLGRGEVFLQASYDDWGVHLGHRRLQLSAENADLHTEPVTGWIPAIYADRVKLAVVNSGNTNLTIQPVFQTATGVPTSAGAWSSTGMGSAISVGESCTGELQPNAPTGIAAFMWVRFGIGYARTTASPTRGEANVAVSISVRTL